MSQHVNQAVAFNSPFNLAENSAYNRWRDECLLYASPKLDDVLVLIDDPYQLSELEKAKIASCCGKFNMAIYQLKDIRVQEKSLVHDLGRQLGLLNLDANLRSDEDSVSSLEVREQAGNQYIPYTNKALSWHTDGYYNHLDKQIYGIVMHCVRPSAQGGINALLNPESVYIKLRDTNKVYIEALMHPEAMTIPENVDAGKVIREAQTGPVFMVKAPVGLEADRLHMRFSARKRNIIWRDTAETHEAVKMINALLADESNVFKVALKAGQGIVCNNVLHNRSSFVDSDGQKRLLYRARYFDVIASK